MEIDANFYFNNSLARAIVQILPANQRRNIRLWFDKLLEMDKSVAQKESRNEYMLFILLMLQCQKVRAPFNQPPPQALGALRDHVSNKFYEEILLTNDENLTWADESLLGVSQEDIDKHEVRASAPSKFLDHQPWPNEGMVCYLAAFSDHDY